MEHMMYRRGESVSRQLHSMDVQDAGSRDYNSPEITRHSGSGSPFTPHFYSADQRCSTTPSSEQMALSRKVDELMSMVSGTQHMLLNQQAASQRLEEKFGKLSQDVCGLKRELEGMKSSLSSSESSAKSTRVKIPSGLSLSVKKLCEESDVEYKFNGSEMYNSVHNKRVADFLYEQLAGQHGGAYTPQTMKRSIHRYYESRRRIYNDSKPCRQSKVAQNKKNAQRKGFQKRLYEKRMKFVKKDDESSKWAHIDDRYMTEESESEEEGNIRRHKLPWRSTVLNNLVQKLDRRAERAEKGVGRFITKCRVDSSDSTLPPPPDAPTWTLKPSETPSSEIQTPSDSSLTSTRQKDASLIDTPLSAGQPAVGSVRRRLPVTSSVHQLLDGEDESSNSSSESEMN